MRILRIVLIFIFVLAGLYLIACLFIPGDYKIERSETFNAPVDIVYEKVSSFRKWEKWNPWHDKDPELKTLFSSDDGSKGSYCKWKGTKGEGRLVMTENIENASLKYHIFIEKPYPSESDGYLTLEPNGNETKVTWGFVGSNPFYLRVINLFIDKTFGPDFEKGLNLLKSLAENDAAILRNEYFGYRIKQSEIEPLKLGYIRKALLFEDVDEFFVKGYEKITTEAKNCNFKINGPRLALFYGRDEINSISNIALAVPIEGDSTLGHDLAIMDFKGHKALLLDYYGGYKSNAKAYKALDNFVRNKGYRTKKPVIEQYITGPSQQKDSLKWHTKIWYLLD